MLSSCVVDILGIKADDMMLPDQTTLMGYWKFLDPDASRDAVADEENGNIVVSIDRASRACRPMPVFFRACQGHS
eukprot:2992305-Pyramimonas_sp.AAC.1